MPLVASDATEEKEDESTATAVDAKETGPDECIVLNITGEFGHFRKPATTSPAQTFGIPPRTTVAGMLAGMLGMERDSYYELFSRANSSVAVSLESSVRRLSIGINVLTTEGPATSPHGGRPGKHITDHRQQTTFEVLCDPAYRVYVALDDADIMDRMEEMFAAGKSTYTLSLGVSEHVATFDYVGRFEVGTATGRAEIRSAVPGEQVDLIPDPDARYVSERLPAFMKRTQSGRVADGSQRLTYDRNGSAIELRDTAHSIVGTDAVVFS